MERLTRKSDTSDMVWFIDREHESGYAEREPCDMDAHHARLAIAKLAEYEDLEEQGKLLELPCAVGDTIYEPRPDRGMITEYRVSSLTYSGGEVFVGWQLNSGIYSNLDGVPANKIGKTVFLTRAEAEAAIQEVNHD